MNDRPDPAAADLYMAVAERDARLRAEGKFHLMMNPPAWYVRALADRLSEMQRVRPRIDSLPDGEDDWDFCD